MLVKKLRSSALPALMGMAVACSILMPSAAFAEESTSNESALSEALTAQFSDSFAQTQTELQASIIDSCTEIAHQAKTGILLDTALSLQGTPYMYGGTTPRGFDCSGFTRYCFKNALGIDLPRTAAGQAALGESVPMDELQPGDLVFWGHGSGIYHVGIYVEEGKYIHAASSGSVKVADMKYFTPNFAKRI